MKCLTCHGLITNGNCGCSTGTQGAASVDIGIILRSRDAEIAALKAQIDEDNRVILAVREHNRLRAALAAGPAALRDKACPRNDCGDCEAWRRASDVVEAAQAAALKDDNKRGGG